MPKKHSEEPIERLIIKVPKSLAAYFRKAFPHGRRSAFVAECIRNYQKNQEIGEMENKLRQLTKQRQ